MKKLNLFFCLIYLYFSSILTSCINENNAINSCWNSYKEAILNNNGNIAVSHLSKNTITYYNDLIESTLYDDKDKLNKQILINKFMILRLRHEFNLAQIKELNGEKIIIYSINNGWIGKNSVIDNSIRNIEISNNFATANVLSNNKDTGIKYQFYKENGEWKLDLTFIMKISNQIITKQILDQGYEENQYLLTLIESVSGKKVEKTIYNPLITK